MQRALFAGVLTAAALVTLMMTTTRDAQAAGRGQPTDWNRFYNYPYVYYPHNFQRPQGSYDNLYHRYPPNMRIPVYNKNWINFYPSARPYHRGHHFELDVF